MVDVRIVRNEEYERWAQMVISSARRSLFFSTFKAHLTKKPIGFGCNKILDSLLEAIRRGVEVKVLLECGDMSKSIVKLNRIVAGRLASAGAKVRYLPGKRVVHAKIILSDSLWLLAGSHNWSVGSLRRNFEISFLIRESEVGVSVQSFFEKEWDRACDFLP